MATEKQINYLKDLIDKAIKDIEEDAIFSMELKESFKQFQAKKHGVSLPFEDNFSNEAKAWRKLRRQTKSSDWQEFAAPMIAKLQNLDLDQLTTSQASDLISALKKSKISFIDHDAPTTASEDLTKALEERRIYL